MKSNTRAESRKKTRRKFKFILSGIGIGVASLVGIFFLTQGSIPHTSELSYVDFSPQGAEGGSVVPASCDSSDWRGAYCAGTYNPSQCHASQTSSFCPTDGLTCEYDSGGLLYHSGSHFQGDCTTPCPGNAAYSYDPYFDPNHTTCPALPPAEPTFSAWCTLQSNGRFSIQLGWGGVAGAVNYPVRLQGPSHATNPGVGQSGGADIMGWGAVGDTAPTASGFTWTGLTAPGSYSHWGHAWNTNGWSTATGRSVSCIIPAPTITSATPGACGTGQITIAWTSVTGATDYKLTDQTTGVYGFVAGTSYTHTGLTANSSHTYVVQANIPGGSSANSAQVTRTAPNVCSPSVPVLTVTQGACGTGQLTMNWSASSGATAYTPKYWSGGVWYNYPNVTPPTTSYTITGLANGAPHSVRVTASNSAGVADSNIVDTYAPPACGAVINGACGAAATNYAASATSYSGAFCSAGTASPASPAFPTQGGSTSWTCLGSGGGSNSPLCTATRSAATANQPPNVNAGLDRAITLPTTNSSASGASASDPDGSIASLSWSFVSGPATPTIANGTTLTPTFSNMTVAGTYTFRLTATDNLGLSANDTMQVVVSAAAGGAPATPTGLTATPGSCGTGQINVSWNASSGATNYTLTRNGAGVNDYVTSLTSMSDTGLAAGSSNTYTIRANNANGSSPASSQVTATAPAACVSTCTGTADYTVTGNTAGTVWGTDIYTDDSDVGAAAVHFGLIAIGQVATIRTTKIGDRTSYIGTNRNGVTTLNYAPSWCAMTLSSLASPDLVPQIVTAPAASVTAGNTITLAARAFNQGSGSTGVGFSNNMTYQWNGTGGTWKSFNPTQTFSKSALSAGNVATNDTYSFSTTTTGTLYLQYCVDAVPASGAISESLEGNNCWQSTGTVVSSPSGCSAQTIANCDVPARSNGGTGGVCSNGYSGTCSYTCSSSTWTTPSSNTCSGPSITTFRVCTDATGACTNSPGTHTVPVSTPLTLTWASNSDSCSAVTGTGFATGGLASGSDGITSAATPNTTTAYTVACSYGSGTPVQRSLNVLTSSAAPTLSVSKLTVSVGDTITLSWDTNNGNEGSCSLTGGGLTSATLTNGTGDAETGSTSVTITGRTTFTLTCAGQTDLKTVDVIPVGWES